MTPFLCEPRTWLEGDGGHLFCSRVDAFDGRVVGDLAAARADPAATPVRARGAPNWGCARSTAKRKLG